MVQVKPLPQFGLRQKQSACQAGVSAASLGAPKIFLKSCVGFGKIFAVSANSSTASEANMRLGGRGKKIRTGDFIFSGRRETAPRNFFSRTLEAGFTAPDLCRINFQMGKNVMSEKWGR